MRIALLAALAAMSLASAPNSADATGRRIWKPMHAAHHHVCHHHHRCRR